MTQDLRRNLNEVARELTFIPRGKDLCHLIIGLPCYRAEDAVGLGDELHIPILDTVMHHLDEVT